MKHKPWRAAAAAETAETAAAETTPDQNHNIPEISNFGDIIKAKYNLFLKRRKTSKSEGDYYCDYYFKLSPFIFTDPTPVSLATYVEKSFFQVYRLDFGHRKEDISFWLSCNWAISNIYRIA